MDIGSLHQDVIELPRVAIGTEVSCPRLGPLGEECVGNHEAVGGTPVLQPLAAGIHRAEAVLSDCAWVIVLISAANTGVEVSAKSPGACASELPLPS